MTVGGILAAVGLFWLARATEHAGYLSAVLGRVVVFGFGLGLIFVSTTIVAVSGVTPGGSGLSSALLNVGQQLGSSLGLAVLGTIAATVTRDELVNHLPTPATVNHAVSLGYSTAFAVGAAIAVVRARPRSHTIDLMPDAA